MSAGKGARRRSFPVLGLGLGIVVAVLVVLEFVLRSFDLVPHTDQINPQLLYDHSATGYHRLKPGLRGLRSLGTEIDSNEFGFRDPHMVLERRQGVFRIALMGDSTAFGWGIEYPEGIVPILEKLLRERHPERPLEILNFSIPGYNLNHHALVLEHEVLRFRPDHVVLLLHLNDIEVLPTPAPWTPSGPAMARFKIPQFIYARVLTPLAIRLGMPNRRFVEEMTRAYGPDGPYLESYLTWLDRYLRLANEAHLGLTVFIAPLPLASTRPYQLQPINDIIKRIFRERGIDVIELLDGYTRYRKDELTLHAYDYHPNAFASQLLAAEIFARLEERRLIR